jgi:hypothetical protein
VQSKASSVAEYLAALPEGRRAALSEVRQTVLDNLDREYEEGITYGMIGYYVPHRIYPPGYHCDPKQPLPFANLASQKNYMSLYLMSVYCSCGLDDPASRHARWFREEWEKTGKKLDMGKSCIRFRRVEDLPLELIGQAVRRVPARTYIRYVEESLARTKKAAAK